MPVIIPTTQEIKDQIVSDIESKINQTVPLLPKAFIRILASTLAGVFTLCYKFGLWIYRQIFPQTADDQALEFLGNRVNIFRKGATQAILEATDTGQDGTTVPAGTLYSSANQIVYSVQNTEIVASGSVTLSFLALTSGEQGNLIPGETLNIVSPIANLDGIATVDSITTEGEDQETIEDYRVRVIDRYQKRPQGGSLIDYITWAKEVAGITRAFAFRINPGFMAIYPIQDNDPSGRIPTPTKLDEVQDYINDPTRKPLQALTFTVAMTEVEFTVEISNLVPDTADIRNAIDENIEDFLFTRQPQQFENEQNLKNVISVSLLTSIAIQSGAQTLDMILKKDVTPVNFYTLGNNELALLDQVIYL